MLIEQIRIYPDPILRQVCSLVGPVNKTQQEIFELMTEVLKEKKAVGLSAPQIGIAVRLIIVTDGHSWFRLADPVITSSRGFIESEERCLSCPGKHITIKRAHKIIVNYLTTDGNKTKQFKGLFAVAIQHEIDHLNGKLIIDYEKPEPKKGTRSKNAMGDFCAYLGFAVTALDEHKNMMEERRSK